MPFQIFQVDAFTDRIFGGNPAAICPLRIWLPDEILQAIARENNQAETAFFTPSGNGFHLRWFTPEIEMDLCGHATLATAHVLYNHLGYVEDEIIFHSASGNLSVFRKDGRLVLDFPARMPVPASLPEVIVSGMGKTPLEVYKSRDYLLVYETEADILSLRPDVALLNTINLDPGGIIATARGNSSDFVSRFFTPQASIFEDPVTGSAHCSLIPFWAARLGKNKLFARQLSRRQGELFCENHGSRVRIGGTAVTYSEGTLLI